MFLFVCLYGLNLFKIEWCWESGTRRFFSIHFHRQFKNVYTICSTPHINSMPHNRHIYNINNIDRPFATISLYPWNTYTHWFARTSFPKKKVAVCCWLATCTGARCRFRVYRLFPSNTKAKYSLSFRFRDLNAPNNFMPAVGLPSLLEWFYFIKRYRNSWAVRSQASLIPNCVYMYE